jgi:hypothetical protein
MDMDGHGTIITQEGRPSRQEPQNLKNLANCPTFCLQHKSIIFGNLQKQVPKLSDENQTKVV